MLGPAVLALVLALAAASPVPDGAVITCTTLQGGLKALCNGTTYSLLSVVGLNNEPFVTCQAPLMAQR